MVHENRESTVHVCMCIHYWAPLNVAHILVIFDVGLGYIFFFGAHILAQCIIAEVLETHHPHRATCIP